MPLKLHTVTDLVGYILCEQEEHFETAVTLNRHESDKKQSDKLNLRCLGFCNLKTQNPCKISIIHNNLTHTG